MADVYVDTFHKLEALKETFSDSFELSRVLTKLLSVVLNQYQLRLERYARDLRDFEDRYGMDTPTFYKRFEAGELGDSADFFEWAGLYDLHQDLVDKIHRLELAL
ncbi:MAG: hypothetical protein ABIL11_10120 [Chloroflexota bacterium]